MPKTRQDSMIKCLANKNVHFSCNVANVEQCVTENFKMKKMPNFSVIILQKELRFTMGRNREHINGKKPWNLN